MSADKKKGGFRDTPNLEVLSQNPAISDFLTGGKSESPDPVVDIKEGTVESKQEDEYPWMSVSGDDRTQHITRVPLQLKKLIEYLGDTTRGENMTSISVAGLTHQAEKMAKEKGLPLPASWGSWLKK